MTRKSINRFKNRGFTLVELIVSLALLIILLGAVFGFYLNNIKSFKRTDRLTQVQFDVRMASDYISSELRNVNYVSIVAQEATMPNEINLNILQSKYPQVEHVYFDILPEKDTVDGPKFLMRITVNGGDLDSQDYYQLETEVLMNNVEKSIEVDTDPSSVVYYNKLTIS